MNQPGTNPIGYRPAGPPHPPIYQPPTYQPNPPRRPLGSVRAKIIAGLVAVAVGVAGGAIWATVGSSGSAAPNDVALETVSFAGDNPFMGPVGQDRQDVKATAAAAGAYSGDTKGLYTQGVDRPSCDAAALLQGLRSDEVRARAWASALHIPYEGINDFVSGLTPVVLRSDTAVTNNGYRAPNFYSYPAVLQAGTAVFVSSFGEPKVKCYNGNPLSAGATHRGAHYVGGGWGSFRPTYVTIIKPAPVRPPFICIGGKGGDGNGGVGGSGGAGCVIVTPPPPNNPCLQNPWLPGCGWPPWHPPSWKFCRDHPDADVCKQPICDGSSHPEGCGPPPCPKNWHNKECQQPVCGKNADAPHCPPTPICDGNSHAEGCQPSTCDNGSHAKECRPTGCAIADSTTSTDAAGKPCRPSGPCPRSSEDADCGRPCPDSAPSDHCKPGPTHGPGSCPDELEERGCDNPTVVQPNPGCAVKPTPAGCPTILPGTETETKTTTEPGTTNTPPQTEPEPVTTTGTTTSSPVIPEPETGSSTGNTTSSPIKPGPKTSTGPTRGFGSTSGSASGAGSSSSAGTNGTAGSGTAADSHQATTKPDDE